MGWDAASQVGLRAFGIGISGRWVRDDAWAIRLAPCLTPKRLRDRERGRMMMKDWCMLDVWCVWMWNGGSL